MKGITRGDYNEAQIASLLTVFQMRGVKVNELTGFREALLTTRVPVDFSDFQPIDIVGTGGDGKIRLISLLVPVSSLPGPDMP